MRLHCIGSAISDASFEIIQGSFTAPNHDCNLSYLQSPLSALRRNKTAHRNIFPHRFPLIELNNHRFVKYSQRRCELFLRASRSVNCSFQNLYHLPRQALRNSIFTLFSYVCKPWSQLNIVAMVLTADAQSGGDFLGKSPAHLCSLRNPGTWHQPTSNRLKTTRHLMRDTQRLRVTSRSLPEMSLGVLGTQHLAMSSAGFGITVPATGQEDKYATFNTELPTD